MRTFATLIIKTEDLFPGMEVCFRRDNEEVNHIPWEQCEEYNEIPYNLPLWLVGSYTHNSSLQYIHLVYACSPEEASEIHKKVFTMEDNKDHIMFRVYLE